MKPKYLITVLSNGKEGGLPEKPPIPEAYLEHAAKRPYRGVIEPGMVFAWEPTISTARELTIVTRISPPPSPIVVESPTMKAVISRGDDEVVWSRAFPDGTEEYYNEIERFREAVVPTMFRRMPTECVPSPPSL